MQNCTSTRCPGPSAVASGLWAAAAAATAASVSAVSNLREEGGVSDSPLIRRGRVRGAGGRTRARPHRAPGDLP